jgi:hypothetical protein
MSPAFPTRRRADDFDRLVEAALHGTTPPQGLPAGDLAELAGLAVGLRDVPRIEPRPAFSADLRERLMTAAATELTPAEDVTRRLTVHPSPATRRGHRRITVGIAALAIIGGSAGTALASQGALPGQPLYSVKRVIEDVRSGFSTSDSAKGAALLSDAHRRLDEAAKLSRDSGADHEDEISSTLDTFSQQAKSASDLLLTNYEQHHDTGSIQKLHAYTSASIDQLTVLEPLVPAGAKQALVDAAQTVLTIDTAARNACPDCGGPSITSLPATLLDTVAQHADSTGKAAKPKLPSASTSPAPGPGVALPSVPSDVGPANVAPSTKPAPSSPGQVLPSLGGHPSKLLPKHPSSGPTALGQTVDGLTKGLTGTVDGLLGTVGGVLGGGSGGSTSPTP